MIGGRLRFLALYQKYFLVLFLAVVIPLAASGVSEAWFGYRDQRARLHQLLGIEARSAAARIQDFIEGITNQLGWLVQLPWSDEPDERRRIDAARLLRKVSTEGMRPFEASSIPNRLASLAAGTPPEHARAYSAEATYSSKSARSFRAAALRSPVATFAIVAAARRFSTARASIRQRPTTPAAFVSSGARSGGSPSTS